MSRAYRIRVSESLDRVDRVEDGLDARLEILDVLPRDAMVDHLRAALERRGFVPVEGEPDVLEAPADGDDGLSIRVDVRQGVLQARASAEVRVRASRTLDRAVENEERGLASARAEVADRLEADAAAQADTARQALTQRLEERLQEVRPTVDQAVNEATAEALKVRAGQLGEVQSVEEDGQSLVIRVKL